MWRSETWCDSMVLNSQLYGCPMLCAEEARIVVASQSVRDMYYAVSQFSNTIFIGLDVLDGVAWEFGCCAYGCVAS
ncbi:hypothetical protein V3C99_003257 [Haemonchus contortus]